MIRVNFTHFHPFKRSDLDYQKGLAKLINDECPLDLKSEIESNNAYFEDYLDEFDKHQITSHAHSNELSDKMDKFLDSFA